MSIIKRPINGLDTESELPPFGTSDANKYLKINNNANDIEWSVISDNVGLPDGSASNPSEYFIADPDTGIFRPGTNQLGISAGGTSRMVISDTATTISNDLNLSTNSRENNYYIAFTNASKALTLQSRQFRYIGIEITALSGAGNDGTLTIPAMSNGDSYEIEAYSGASANGRVLNLVLGNTCWNLETHSSVASGASIVLHTQVANVPSYSHWIVYRHNQTNVHLKRIACRNQPQNLQTLSLLGGSAGAPALTFSNPETGSNSGLYNPADNDVRISCGGSDSIQFFTDYVKEFVPTWLNETTISSAFTIPNTGIKKLYRCDGGPYTVTLPILANPSTLNGFFFYIYKSAYNGNNITIACQDANHLINEITNGTFIMTRGSTLFMVIHEYVGAYSRWYIRSMNPISNVQSQDNIILFDYGASATIPTIGFRAQASTGTHNTVGFGVSATDTLNVITANTSRMVFDTANITANLPLSSTYLQSTAPIKNASSIWVNLTNGQSYDINTSTTNPVYSVYSFQHPHTATVNATLNLYPDAMTTGITTIINCYVTTNTSATSNTDIVLVNKSPTNIIYCPHINSSINQNSSVTLLTSSRAQPMTSTWIISRMGTANVHLFELDSMVKRCHNLLLKNIRVMGTITYTNNVTLVFDNNTPINEYIIMDTTAAARTLTFPAYNSNFAGSLNLEGLSFFVVKNGSNSLTFTRNATTDLINGTASDLAWTGTHVYVYRKVVLTVNVTNSRFEWLIMNSD